MKTGAIHGFTKVGYHQGVHQTGELRSSWLVPKNFRDGLKKYGGNTALGWGLVLGFGERAKLDKLFMLDGVRLNYYRRGLVALVVAGLVVATLGDGTALAATQAVGWEARLAEEEARQAARAAVDVFNAVTAAGQGEVGAAREGGDDAGGRVGIAGVTAVRRSVAEAEASVVAIDLEALSLDKETGVGVGVVEVDLVLEAREGVGSGVVVKGSAAYGDGLTGLPVSFSSVVLEGEPPAGVNIDVSEELVEDEAGAVSGPTGHTSTMPCPGGEPGFYYYLIQENNPDFLETNKQFVNRYVPGQGFDESKLGKRQWMVGYECLLDPPPVGYLEDPKLPRDFELSATLMFFDLPSFLSTMWPPSIHPKIKEVAPDGLILKWYDKAARMGNPVGIRTAILRVLEYFDELYARVVPKVQSLKQTPLRRLLNRWGMVSFDTEKSIWALTTPGGGKLKGLGKVVGIPSISITIDASLTTTEMVIYNIANNLSLACLLKIPAMMPLCTAGFIIDFLDPSLKKEIIVGYTRGYGRIGDSLECFYRAGLVNIHDAAAVGKIIYNWTNSEPVEKACGEMQDAWKELAEAQSKAQAASDEAKAAQDEALFAAGEAATGASNAARTASQGNVAAAREGADYADRQADIAEAAAARAEAAVAEAELNSAIAQSYGASQAVTVAKNRAGDAANFAGSARESADQAQVFAAEAEAAYQAEIAAQAASNAAIGASNAVAAASQDNMEAAREAADYTARQADIAEAAADEAERQADIAGTAAARQSATAARQSATAARQSAIDAAAAAMGPPLPPCVLNPDAEECNPCKANPTAPGCDPCDANPNAPGCDPCDANPTAPGCDPCDANPTAPGCDPCDANPNAPGCKEKPDCNIDSDAEGCKEKPDCNIDSDAEGCKEKPVCEDVGDPDGCSVTPPVTAVTVVTPPLMICEDEDDPDGCSVTPPVTAVTVVTPPLMICEDEDDPDGCSVTPAGDCGDCGDSAADDLRR